MAEVVDETAAVEAVETSVVLDDLAPTQAAELAWSSEQPELGDLAYAPPMPLPVEPAPWRAVCRNALAVFSVCVAVAGAVTLVDRHWFAELRTATVASVAPTHSAPPTPDAITTPTNDAPTVAYPTGVPAEHMVPPVRAIPPDVELPAGTYNADAFYLNTLRSYGIRITNPYVAIEAAQTTCGYLRAGHSPNEAVGVAMSNNATLSIDQARGYVIAATAAYCPDVAPH